MKSRLFIALAAILILIAGSLILWKHLSPASERDLDKPKRVAVRPKVSSVSVFGSAAEEESVKELMTFLGDAGGVAVTRAATLEAGIVSSADILILLLDSPDLTAAGPYDVRLLRNRKVIGIGYGAAKLFENARLKIAAGKCAHGVPGRPGIVIQRNTLLDHTAFPEAITLFDPPIIDQDFHNDILFGIYVGEKHPENRVGIEIVALFSTDSRYAPVTRQGQAVLIGVNSHVGNWSRPFRTFVREMILAFR